MPYFAKPCLFILCIVLLNACYLTKAAMDKDMVEINTKNAREIEELALFAVVYTKEKGVYSLNTNQFSDPDMKKLGKYGSLVSVHLRRSGDTVAGAWEHSHVLFADSTVMFSSITLRGTLRTIYDLAKVPRHFDRPNDALFFQAVTDRIYYIRTEIPFM